MINILVGLFGGIIAVLAGVLAILVASALVCGFFYITLYIPMALAIAGFDFVKEEAGNWVYVSIALASLVSIAVSYYFGKMIIGLF